jgi:hypothetical protein
MSMAIQQAQSILGEVPDVTNQIIQWMQAKKLLRTQAQMKQGLSEQIAGLKQGNLVQAMYGKEAADQQKASGMPLFMIGGEMRTVGEPLPIGVSKTIIQPEDVLTPGQKFQQGLLNSGKVLEQAKKNDAYIEQVNQEYLKSLFPENIDVAKRTADWVPQENAWGPTGRLVRKALK